MDTIVLSARGLTKTFGLPAGRQAHTAVDHISFDVKEGEVLGILGPNGAGKTTTIYMLLDLITPTAGEITIFGKRYLDHREEILQRMNFASTYMDMMPRLTVMENLLVMTYLYRVKQAKETILRLAKLIGVSDLLHWQYQKLSAGQKTRVQLCKAFLNDPKLLLLDEPTASLDPDIAITIRQQIQEAKKRGMTIVITSHNMVEVEEVCDRVLFLSCGKILAEDTPEGLARAVRKVRVQLMIKDGQKRTIAFSKKAGFSVLASDRFVTIDVDESDIAYLLAGLADKGVEYKQIAIDKPTLEDYFIAMAKEHI